MSEVLKHFSSWEWMLRQYCPMIDILAIVHSLSHYAFCLYIIEIDKLVA